MLSEFKVPAHDECVPWPSASSSAGPWARWSTRWSTTSSCPRWDGPRRGGLGQLRSCSRPRPAAIRRPKVAIRPAFLNAIIAFVVIALVVWQISKMFIKEPAPAAARPAPSARKRTRPTRRNAGPAPAKSEPEPSFGQGPRPTARPRRLSDNNPAPESWWSPGRARPGRPASTVRRYRRRVDPEDVFPGALPAGAGTPACSCSSNARRRRAGPRGACRARCERPGQGSSGGPSTAARRSAGQPGPVRGPWRGPVGRLRRSPRSRRRTAGRPLPWPFATSPGRCSLCPRVFAGHGLNMSKLESHPSRERAWEYVFWVDLDADTAEPSTQAAGRARPGDLRRMLGEGHRAELHSGRGPARRPDAISSPARRPAVAATSCASILNASYGDRWRAP